MPIDQNLNAPTAATEPEAVSAIENEIPAYRAISPQAVFALIFGVLSILCFTHWFFLTFAALAVLSGVLAERKIQRMPEVLTGRGLAQAGIGLGLVFGLTALTTSTVQNVLRQTQATAFARKYETVLKKGTLEDAIWYGQAPTIRKQTTPEKMIEEMKKRGGDSRMIEMQTAGLRELKSRLTEPGGDLHFDRIESHGEDGMNLFAAVLFEVHSPQRKAPAEKEQYALAYMKAMKTDGKYEWWVEDIRFPYQPASFVVPQKPVDDGHGHAPH